MTMSADCTDFLRQNAQASHVLRNFAASSSDTTQFPSVFTNWRVVRWRTNIILLMLPEAMVFLRLSHAAQGAAKCILHKRVIDMGHAKRAQFSVWLPKPATN